MATFKCKMCGGSLNINPGETIATCEYCETKQTLPRLDDDRRAQLYDRANHFRRNNEFDKAAGIYESILDEQTTDAEAYWSLVLCRYGIEYVEDPTSRKRIPTINRIQFTSIFDDEDYKSAIQYADGYQREIYEAEADAINEIQKGFLAISQKEEPFDVFICYKETDVQGRRTQDSVLATELYHELTREGFKVFFARITLEDKLGSAYEPYIFAALQSSKAMVVLGTRPEHFNAIWVKNEWSRYLALIKNGAKKTLIPAYRGMDPYELPDEFSHLQAQDMSKLGFMQDLTRGIKKILEADTPAPVVKETVITTAGPISISPLLKRAKLFLEGGEWENAANYCEKALDIDPENADAYIYKLLSQLKGSDEKDLLKSTQPLENYTLFKYALRFADEETAKRLNEYNRLTVEKYNEMRNTLNKLQEERSTADYNLKSMKVQRAELKLKNNNVQQEYTRILAKAHPRKSALFALISILFVPIGFFGLAKAPGMVWFIFVILGISMFIYYNIRMLDAQKLKYTLLYVGYFTFMIPLIIWDVITIVRSIDRNSEQLQQTAYQLSAQIDNLTMQINTQEILLEDLDKKILDQQKFLGLPTTSQARILNLQ